MWIKHVFYHAVFYLNLNSNASQSLFFFLVSDVLLPLMCCFQCADCKTRTSCHCAARRGERSTPQSRPVASLSSQTETRHAKRECFTLAASKNRPFVPCDGAVGYRGNHSCRGNGAAQTVVCSPLFRGVFRAGIRERWNQPPRHPTPFPERCSTEELKLMVSWSTLTGGLLKSRPVPASGEGHSGRWPPLPPAYFLFYFFF